MRKLILAFLISLALSTAAGAQSIWLQVIVPVGGYTRGQIISDPSTISSVLATYGGGYFNAIVAGSTPPPLPSTNGLQLGNWATSTRPAGVPNGTLGLNSTLGQIDAMLGGTWTQLVPATGSNLSVNLGTGALTAQGGVNTTGNVTGNVSPSTSTATGGTTALTEAFRQSARLTVEDFGAKGDCSTDDSAAFNAYAAFVRASTGYQALRTIALGSNKCYMIKSPINFSKFTPYTVTVHGNGSTIIGNVGATHAVIDAMHSYINIDNLHIITQGSVLYGVQAGNDGSAGSDVPFHFTNVNMLGTFVNADLYDRAAEGSSFISGNLNTQSTNSYAVILDGMCHWAIDTTYTTDSCTQNSVQSFNEQVFLNTVFSNSNTTSGTSSPLWIGGQLDHARFIGGYVETVSSSPSVVIYAGLAESTFYHFDDILFDIHFEVNPTAEFFVTGTIATPSLHNFEYRQHYEQAAANASLFKLDTGITALSAVDLRLTLGGVQNTGVTVFDQPAKYSGTAHVELPSGLSWNAAAGSFQGTIGSGTSETAITKLQTYTVGTLPACNATLANQALAVSDATSPTYNGTLTGGGAVSVPVFCNGSAWVSH